MDCLLTQKLENHMTEKKYKGFIRHPENFEEFVHNAQFQLDNVNAWMDYKKYENALIKAECLVSDLKLAVAAQSKVLPTDPSVYNGSDS